MRFAPGLGSPTGQRGSLNARVAVFIMILIAAMGSASAAGAYGYDLTSHAENVVLQVPTTSDASVAPASLMRERPAWGLSPAASASRYGYDAPPIAHIEVDAFLIPDALANPVTAARDASGSRSVACHDTSMTPVIADVATNTADDIIAIAPNGNPGAFPFSGSTGLTSRASAREALAGLGGATPEQIAAANRAIGRGTSTSTYNVGTFGEQVVVQVQRPGANGYQVVETVVSPDGSKFVVQKAYDATGQLVHYDPKTP